MQCGTCKESKSEQLPTSEVCRHCHNYSRWCQSVPETVEYPVMLYLHDTRTGVRYVSSSKMGRVIAKKTISVSFEDAR